MKIENPSHHQKTSRGLWFTIFVYTTLLKINNIFADLSEEQYRREKEMQERKAEENPNWVITLYPISYSYRYLNVERVDLATLVAKGKIGLVVLRITVVVVTAAAAQNQKRSGPQDPFLPQAILILPRVLVDHAKWHSLPLSPHSFSFLSPHSFPFFYFKFTTFKDAPT